MTWRHLQAFVWLRYRLLFNQWRRAGKLNAALTMIVVVALLVTAIPLFFGSVALGMYAIPRLSPAVLMYVWDGLIAAFLMFWGIGLLTELQKSEPLALSKFLHLPISLNGAFLINYLSSLTRLSLILFGPVMLGFSLALVATKGVVMLAVLPLLAAFLLSVTALTYQFQGWLASLMSNPRRRRTVIVATTALFILVFQLPNLLNIYSPFGVQGRADRSNRLAADLAKLNVAAQAKEFDAAEHLRRQEQLMETSKREQNEADRAGLERIQRTVRLANVCVPVGWLPLGVMTAAEGQVWPSLLGLLGLSLIGSASLWRAYRSTVRQYQGEATNRQVRAAPVAAPRPTIKEGGVLLLERKVPGLSEPVSAIALGGFRGLVRSPEAKMMLLTPAIMGVVFGSMMMKGTQTIPEPFRPLMAMSGMVFVLFGVLQLMGNQFGFDRDGFRVFVLCAAPRRDILFGKNLAFAPVVLVMAAIVLAAVEAMYPLRIDHLLAMFPQYLSMFLLFCVIANLFSIYAPIYIAAGSMKPSNPKLTVVLLQLLMFLFLFPLAQGVTVIPLGIEAALSLNGWTAGLPVCLLLTLLECAGVILLYKVSLNWLGDVFQAREQRILESVTGRAP